MAFTFQINENVRFNHNEKLLARAEACRPELSRTICRPVGLGKMHKNPVRLEGWEIISAGERLEDLQLGKDEKIILDFGDHQVGQFSISIDSVGSPMDSPLSLQLRFAEVPAELAHTSNEYDGWLARGWIQEEFIHIDELPFRLVLPRRYSARYVEIKVLDTSPKWKAVFSEPEFVSATCAPMDAAEVPDLQDPELERIYRVGLKTLSECMQDVFEDGPKRDRRLWLGDLRLQALANYATFDRADLVRRCLYFFAATTAEDGRISANVFTGKTIIPDDTFLFEYSLFFISVLYDYLEHHPDPEMLEELFGICRRQMDYSLGFVRKSGQFVPDESYPVFTDWSNEFDKTTSGQAMLIYTLRQFISMGRQLDLDMSHYEERLEALTEYSRRELFEPDTGLFMTGNGELNIASQVWMVLADVMDPEENRKLMETTIRKLFPVCGIATPYMYHHIAEAMFKAGMTAEGIDFMKDYWGRMIELGADTFWEAFDPDHPDYSPYGSPIISSYCHAWSCTPVYLIEKYVIPALPMA